MRTESITEMTESQGLGFKVGQKFGEWHAINKLDEGFFGQVIKVRNSTNQKKLASLKAAPNDIQSGNQIRLEIAILLLLNRNGEQPHIPVIYHAAKRRRFCYMVTTLLGPTLRDLKAQWTNQNFSVSTWTRIGIQALYSIKILHDNGFVHRDIKSSNFAMGHPDNPESARIVHLLNFGLSRSYAIEISKGKWIARRPRGTAEFRGSAQGDSPTVREKCELGRKDDIWAMICLLVEFNFGLPWQKEFERYKLEIRNFDFSVDDFLRNLPEELHPVLPHLRQLDMYNRPDYRLIYTCLLKLVAKYNIKYSDKYDWETEEQLSRIQSQYSKPHAYESATIFFSSDPVGINYAPSTPAKSTATMDDSDRLCKLTKG